MNWAPLIALVVLAVAVLAVPGFLLARILRIPVTFSVGFAPALGIAVLGGLSLVCAPMGVLWGWVPLIVVTGNLAAILVVIEVLSRRSAAGRGLPRRRVLGGSAIAVSSGNSGKASGFRPLIYIGLGVFTYAAIRFMTIAVSIGSPDAVPHYGDADFHLQGALLVHDLGDVFPIGALDDLYTPEEHSSVYYPALWHGWVSLLMSFGNVVTATNAAVFAFALVIWPLGIAALGLALRPKNPSMGFLAPVLASPIATFPGALGIGYSVYPYALSMMVLPVGIAALVLWMRGDGLRYGGVYGLAVVASLIAQPTVAIFTIAAGVIGGICLFVRWWYRSVKSGTWLVPTALLTVGTALGIAVLVYVWRLPYLHQLGSFDRPQREENPVLAFFDGTVASVSTPWRPWIVILLLALLGIVTMLRSADGWMYLLITVVTSVAYIAAAGPDGPLRVLTGPWYKDHFRIAAAATMLVAVAAAVGVSWLLDRFIPGHMRSKYGLLGAVLVTIIYPIGWQALGSSITQVERNEVGIGYRLTDENTTALKLDGAELLSRVDEHFDPGERLLSLYGTGGAFVVAYSDVKPFVPLRTMVTPEQRKLAADFDKIESDPEICEILDEYNITGFMADTGRPGVENWGPLGGPPSLDVSNGFELVDQEGDMMLWRITACD